MVTCEVVELAPVLAAAVHGEVGYDGLPQFFHDAFTKVLEAVGPAGATVTGEPFGYYPRVPGDVVVVEAGFPTSAPVDAGDVHTLELPGGPAVVAIHVGPYETVEKTYAELMTWTAEQGLAMGEAMWECYLSDPSAEPDPNTWRTRIVWPLRAGQGTRTERTSTTG